MNTRYNTRRWVSVYSDALSGFKVIFNKIYISHDIDCFIFAVNVSFFFIAIDLYVYTGIYYCIFWDILSDSNTTKTARTIMHLNYSNHGFYQANKKDSPKYVWK